LSRRAGNHAEQQAQRFFHIQQLIGCGLRLATDVAFILPFARNSTRRRTRVRPESYRFRIGHRAAG